LRKNEKKKNDSYECIKKKTLTKTLSKLVVEKHKREYPKNFEERKREISKLNNCAGPR
jgi:ribosomal protein S17E